MATFDYFLRLDGIPGESTDAKHKGEIDVLSWSWGESETLPPAGGGAGGGAGKVHIEDLHVTAATSKASPRLMLACASGQHFKSAVISGHKAGTDQVEFLKFSLTDVIVSAYRINASDAVPPVDTFSLSFGKIEFRHTQQKPDGSPGDVTSAGWDVKQSKPV
jgi:type VI secretion system secreted protein Hcp